MLGLSGATVMTGSVGGFRSNPLLCLRPTKGERTMNKKYVEVTHMVGDQPQARYVDTIKNVGGFLEALEDGDVGETYRMKFIEMTPEEFEALPEFTGF